MRSWRAPDMSARSFCCRMHEPQSTARVLASARQTFVHGGSHMEQHEIDRQVFALYDEYCHGVFDRREFLRRASSLSVVGVPALTMAEAMLPQYAKAQTISFTDQRIKSTYVEYPSPGGTSGKMRGYLVQPTTQGPYPV